MVLGAPQGSTYTTAGILNNPDLRLNGHPALTYNGIRQPITSTRPSLGSYNQHNGGRRFDNGLESVNVKTGSQVKNPAADKATTIADLMSETVNSVAPAYSNRNKFPVASILPQGARSTVKTGLEKSGKSLSSLVFRRPGYTPYASNYVPFGLRRGQDTSYLNSFGLRRGQDTSYLNSFVSINVSLIIYS